MRTIEIPFKNKIIREKNRYIRNAAQYASAHRTTSTTQFFEHRQNMRDILETYYKRSIRLFSRYTEKGFGKKNVMPVIERKSLWEDLFRSYVMKYGAIKAAQTAETTRIDIQTAIFSALNQTEALSEQAFTKKILSVRGLSPFRADTIARTETHAAAMYASRETARDMIIDTGVERKKKWVPALDERTRSSHAAMQHSKPIQIDEAFIVNGERLQNPADPAGSAGNVINCRCVMVYV